MNKKITIGRIARKEINTKYGPKWKLGVQDKDTQEWYNAWAGAWNQTWKEGQVIEIEFTQDQYGKQIKAPESVKGGYGGNSSQIMQELTEIKSLLIDVLSHLQTQKVKEVFEVEEDLPPF